MSLQTNLATYARGLKQLPPDEGHERADFWITSELADKNLFLEVLQQKEELTVNRTWIVDADNLSEVEKIEFAGVKDLDQIRQHPTQEERIREFVSIANSTKYPSLILLLEAENIVEFSTPADQRFEIVKAFNNVLGRADAAGYVRRYAYNETKNLSSVRDETRVRILFSTTLINVFHAQSQETLNSDFTHFILFALRQSLRYVTKEPELDAAEKQLIDDLRAYEKRVSELKGAQVAITRREIDGNTVNEYSGPDDKVRLMTLIKPLLDLLGQQ